MRGHPRVGKGAFLGGESGIGGETEPEGVGISENLFHHILTLIQSCLALYWSTQTSASCIWWSSVYPQKFGWSVTLGMEETSPYCKETSSCLLNLHWIQVPMQVRVWLSVCLDFRRKE